MKKILIASLIQVLFTTCVFGQVYKVPSKNYFTSKMQVHFVGQFRKGVDGLFHYLEMNGREIPSTEYDQYTEGIEHFYCYDKTNNMYYFYTENTLGYYNPQIINYINYMKNIFKKTDVKNVKEEEAKAIMSRMYNEMKSRYERKNDSIAEIKRIEREKFVKDSIETARRKAIEYEEYRKKHNWHELQLSKYHSLECEFCHIDHRFDHLYVISLCADTIYYLRDDADMTLLGNRLSGLHYSAMSRELKNDTKFRFYEEAWQDSIAHYDNFTNNGADIINLVNYNEFKSSIKKIAPNGFVRNWGWHLNSADGVEPNFTFFNTSDKTIKYVDFYFSLFNAVGDRCFLKYEKSYVGNVRGVGPVESFETGSWSWDRATHYTSGDASEMRVVKIIITYMDKTTRILTGNSLFFE